MKQLLSFCFALTTFITTAFAADTITPDAAFEKVKSGALLVDVRTPEEFQSGALAGAVNIPHDQVESRVAEFGSNKDREIVLYCRSGRRSGLAEDTLRRIGFTHVANAGGYEDLKSKFAATK